VYCFTGKDYLAGGVNRSVFIGHRRSVLSSVHTSC